MIPRHFDSVRSIQTHLPGCHIDEYYSTFSGVRIFIINFESPIVEGVFCLPTETHDNEGLPHTLEHLIFMGSKDYPFKGMLDSLASRCFANGTNAWTQTDHTAFTISTAGFEGFLTILPVYLDHILRPNLSDDDFLTEVHHITEDGGSAGVVYSELQMSENTSDNLMTLEALSHLYPGDSGYKYDAGGKMADVRKTSNHRVRGYHQAYYRWDNLNLIISGKVDVTKLLERVSESEEYHLGKIEAYKHKYEDLFVNVPANLRPWSQKENFAPLVSSSWTQVFFPSGDEESGNLLIAYRTLPWHKMEDLLALEILGEYLTDSNISPMQQKLVEIEDPCCSDIYCYSESWKESCIFFEFSDVPIGTASDPSIKMKEIYSTVKRIYDSILKAGFDLNRLKKIIIRSINAHQQAIETKPHSEFSNLVIEYCVNGIEKNNLNDLLDQKAMLHNLVLRPHQYWLELFKHFLSEGKEVVVESLPSIKFSENLQKKEKAYKNRMLKKFGKNEIKNLKKHIDLVKQRQAQPPPSSLITSLPLPDIKEVKLIDFPTYRNFTVGNSSLEGLLLNDLIELPFCCQMDDISSDFVILTVVTKIPQNWTPEITLSLPLLLELLFESNIVIHDEFFSYSKFSEYLLEILISYGASVGYYEKSLFPNYVTILMTYPIDNFHKGFEILNSVLTNLQFTADRVRCVIKRMLNSITKKKRNASHMLKQIHANTRFNQDSNFCSYGFPRQEKYLRKLLKNIDTTLDSLLNIYNELFEPSHMIIHIATDLKKIKTEWLSHLKLRPESNHEPSKNTGRLKQFPLAHSLWNDARSHNSHLLFGNGVILGLKSCDSSNLSLDICSPYGYNHDSYALLTLLAEYFNLTEGPLYRVTRGGGYTYDCYISFNFATGLLSLVISPASDVVQALKSALECFQTHCISEDTFLSQDLDSARCSLIHSFFDREKTQQSCASQRFLSAFKQVSMDFNSLNAERILSISKKDLNESCISYLQDLCHFDISSDRLISGKSMIIISNSQNVDNINMDLVKRGYSPLTKASLKSIMGWMSQETEADQSESEVSYDECESDESISNSES